MRISQTPSALQNDWLANLLDAQGRRLNCASGGILHLERSSFSLFNSQAVSNEEGGSK
jgi:hypothetical protein